MARARRVTGHLPPGPARARAAGNFGRPRSATIFIASSIGMRAMPLSFSTQP